MQAEEILLRGNLDIFNEIINRIAEVRAVLHIPLDLLNRVNRSRMVSAEFLAYFLIGEVGDFAHNVHGNLSCLGNLGGALGRFNVCSGHFKDTGYLLDNTLDGYRCGLHVVHYVADGVLRHGQRGQLLVKLVGGIDAFYHAL